MEHHTIIIFFSKSKFINKNIVMFLGLAVLAIDHLDLELGRSHLVVQGHGVDPQVLEDLGLTHHHVSL